MGEDASALDLPSGRPAGDRCSLGPPLTPRGWGDRRHGTRRKPAHWVQLPASHRRASRRYKNMLGTGRCAVIVQASVSGCLLDPATSVVIAPRAAPSCEGSRPAGNPKDRDGAPEREPSCPPFGPSARLRVPMMPSTDCCLTVSGDLSPLSPCHGFRMRFVCSVAAWFPGDATRFQPYLRRGRPLWMGRPLDPTPR
jgi:hypothetical protein